MRDPTVGINFNQCVHFPIRSAAHHYKSWPGLRPDAAGTGQTFAAAGSALRNELLAEGGQLALLMLETSAAQVARPRVSQRDFF